MEKNHVKKYLAEVKAIVDKMNVSDIGKMIDVIVNIREKRGRLFFSESEEALGTRVMLSMTFVRLPE